MLSSNISIIPLPPPSLASVVTDGISLRVLIRQLPEIQNLSEGKTTLAAEVS